MQQCNVAIPSAKREDSNLNVSDKYIQLMRDTVSEDSLYIRAKDTFAVLFKDLQINEKEKAEIIAGYLSQMSTSLSGTAMQVALAWSKDERDGSYALAKAKAEAEKTLAEAAKVKEEICLVIQQTAYQCAQIEATIAGSIRENGKVKSWDDKNTCRPTDLEPNGLKYEQTLQVNAATYQIHGDAFRKSGVVKVAIDPLDNRLKGISGSVLAIEGGYTNQQTLNAERQRMAYEDSKINHMLNSLGVVTGQMMSAEVNPATWLLDYMKDGMTKLLTPNKETCSAFDPACTP